MYNSGYDYSSLDRKQNHTHNRRTIDGSITGCGKCVGYCQFSDHSGFLTKEQQAVMQRLDYDFEIVAQLIYSL